MRQVATPAHKAKLLVGARRRIEQFGQANFDPDVLLEPAGCLEVVKHVAGYCEIRRDGNLELEVAPQEVISTDRQITLCYPARQSSDQESAVCSHLLAAPRFLDPNGCIEKGARIIAKEGFDVVRWPLRQRIICQDSGDWRTRRIDHLEGTVAVSVERCISDQIEKQPIQTRRKFSKA